MSTQVTERFAVEALQEFLAGGDGYLDGRQPAVGVGSTDEERARSKVEVCSARLGLEARLVELATVFDRDGRNTSLKGNIVERLVMEHLVAHAQGVPDFSELPFSLERPLPTSWAEARSGPREFGTAHPPREAWTSTSSRAMLSASSYPPTRNAARTPFSCSPRNQEECVAP